MIQHSSWGIEAVQNSFVSLVKFEMGAGSAADVEGRHALLGQEKAQPKHSQARIDRLEEAVVSMGDGAIMYIFSRRGGERGARQQE